MTRSYFSEWSEIQTSFGRDSSMAAHNVMVTFKMNWPLFIGLLVTFIGLAMTAIGLMLQKFAHNKRLRQKDEESKQMYFYSRWWWIGMVVFCIGNLLFWSVLALVPQVVLACWQCWAMVITILLAPVILGEMVTMGKLLNVVVILAGVVWVVMASPGHYEEYTSEQFRAAVHDVVFLSITGGMMILFVVLLASQWWVLEDRMAALRYILIAAIINWYSVLSARCSSGFFLSTVVHQREGISWEFWLLIGMMLGCAGANVHFLNRALECDKAIFVVPIYESLAIAGQILFGIIFFREFDNLSLYQTVNISFAIAVVIGGVLFSSFKEPDTPFLTQVVISEELCGCCFIRSLQEIDESLSSDEENALCTSPRTHSSASRQAYSDPGPQSQAQDRGYRRNGGPKASGDPRGGPRPGRKDADAAG